MLEIWKDIRGYEGYYKVSNLGNIKSLTRTIKQGYNVKGRILTQVEKVGYLYVTLYKDGNRKMFRVHRLVAEAFCKNCNPNKNNVVNHKDENKKNNRASNLEWTTIKDNTNYGTGIKRGANKRSKPIIGINIKTGFVVEFKNAREAQRETKAMYQHISQCCLGKRKSAGGYRWFYK